MTETNNPSGADVDPLAATREFLESACYDVDADDNERAQFWALKTASEDELESVAALIARNAELEAERDGLKRHWALASAAVDDLQNRIAERDALAAENKALKGGMLQLADKIAIYADDDEIDSTRLCRLAHFWQGQLTALARTSAAAGGDGNG